MSEYIVAVKREQRGQVPADWADALEDLDGVTVTKRSGKNRLSVQATPEGIEALRKKLGGFCHIEPVIVHHPIRSR